MSRPRRFGKSLLVSILEAYFKGRKELFEGLAIEGQEQEWKQYPVLKLSMNVENYNSVKRLTDVLDDAVNIWCRQYGMTVDGESPSVRFKNMIIALKEKTGSKVVILVDEYDKPMLQNLENDGLLNQMRDEIKAFYGVLKPMDEYIRFAFFTGCHQFSKVSVFSDLNNLTDISMDKRYVEICGITKKEIRNNLDDEVGELAKETGISKATCYDRLRDYYDGYHFRESCTGLYNPYSLLCALAQREFRDYWFETGTPSYLADTLKQTDYPLDRLTKERLPPNCWQASVR